MIFAQQLRKAFFRLNCPERNISPMPNINVQIPEPSLNLQLGQYTLILWY